MYMRCGDPPCISWRRSRKAVHVHVPWPPAMEALLRRAGHNLISWRLFGAAPEYSVLESESFTKGNNNKLEAMVAFTEHLLPIQANQIQLRPTGVSLRQSPFA